MIISIRRLYTLKFYRSNCLKTLTLIINQFMTRSILYFLALANFLLFVMISPVNAHAFAQRYDLPVPLWLYLLGAGATVAISFLVVIIFLGRDKEDDTPRLELLRTPVGRILSHRYFLLTIKIFSYGVVVSNTS